MNIKRVIGKFKKAWHTITLQAKVSYSQAGEDIIVENLFNSLKIYKPTYLDIGSNEPMLGNNTYGMYRKGCYGVCVEPDLNMIALLKQKRPNSTVLNIGIGLNENPQANFYLFPAQESAWSTFSKEEAELRSNQTGIKFKILQVPLKPINTIIEEHFKTHPNFISIDVEGLDFEILQSINFEKYKPEVICVETITFGFLDNTEEKIEDISTFMHSKGYFTYADTHINTIYCRKDLFKK